ncbi:Asp-tRNA(Asn)/Glu-tRNA(Gln) amidotransferase subunit GatC [Pseudofrancisella aestuarii]|uniref:Aspartyl/glutamyl-tRNA(Asn/Gln) amidotransferase subunit C n=2 Tax=Francisellaceae TaxID=34064 RepID=A0A1J0KTN1_9GAMM|nr:MULTISPECIES: Asp-tRNA(Asn)/Glu-tRNA(Gln) amidotransferase subunit GatC [Francisellaceae]APC97058.1 aspartyl/glutamyl-tRNA(Asn/Gln) amidotransferase, C subunit [Francisella frigiditurris]
MDKQLVEHIAKLSSFKLTSDELEKFTKDLTNICEILDAVKKVDTQGVKPMISPLSVDFKFREDVPTDQDNRKSFEKFACEIVDDYFMVPQVIK